MSLTAAFLVLVTGGMYLQVVHASNDISGTVFQDFNGNGVRDNATAANTSLAADRGLAGVTVTSFAENGSVCDTKTTNSQGAYTLNQGACTGTNFRVEFTGLPAGYNPTQVGSGSNTSTQFIPEGGTANLGVYQGDDFSVSNPLLVTPRLNFGAYNDANAPNTSIFSYPYNSSGIATTPPVSLGTHQQTGAVWGVAYRAANNSVYSSAYMKRHSGFGPGGPGAIYKSASVPASGSVASAPFVTIPNAGTDPHPVSDTNCNSNDGQVSADSGDCWVRDEFSFDAVGKRGIGGLTVYKDLSNPANDALLAVNLNDRQMYKVTNLDGTPTPTGFALPLALPGASQGCALADVRPFSVTVHDGVGYAGLTCSAQSTRLDTNLRAYIYSFNPVTMTFAAAPTLEFPLNYGRSCTDGDSGGCVIRSSWHPWVSNFDDPFLQTVGPLSNGVISTGMAQPVLSDISFGANGSLTIGLLDRYGDQAGHRAFNTDSSDTAMYSSISAGDTLRACLVGSNYVLENAGQCGGTGPGSAGEKSASPGLPQGPGGYEFYNFDYFANAAGNPERHDENSLGGLVQIPGADDVVATSFNPIDDYPDGAYTGGVRHYDSNSGDREDSYRLYQSFAGNSSPYFGKANGLGDVEMVQANPPVEIGNRVWKDTNGNGVQDASEAAIAGVTVRLYNSADVLLATAVTDATGNYIFSNRATDENGAAMVSTSSRRYGIAGLTPNTAGFKLRLDNAADYSDSAKLQSLVLTVQDSMASPGNDDQNDSDASLPDSAQNPGAANAPTITFATAAPGANNHNYDFGFAELVSLGNFIWNDTNNNGIVDGSEATQGLNGVTVNLYACSADTNSDGIMSAAEIAAATAVATTVTANDNRGGATDGRPGYYQFANLQSGCYFVQIAGSNFGASGSLQGYANSPTPAGVADTHDDNNDHGSLPTGGTLATHGIVSSAINLQPGTEPTTTTADADDDTNANSDMTIDFGFWHPYSLGNRVWIDADNSATINAADGVNPGVSGVTVNLLDAANAIVATTTTDAQGYYRFDNLNAGSYTVEIPASNFGVGQPLETYKVSSINLPESANPNDNTDSNDDGINPSGPGAAVRSGVVTLGLGGVEPIAEADLSGSGQGAADDYANMTVDFGFAVPPYKGDTVYFDYDGDQTQGASEPGIPGVTVTLYTAGADGDLNTTGDNVVAATATTNAQGKYLFASLTPNVAYRAEVTASDVAGTPTTTTFFNNAPLGPNEANLTDDFGFNGNGTLGNQIWLDSDKDGVFDSNEQPIRDVTVDLYQDLNCNGIVDAGDTKLGTATTGANGQYQFTNLVTDDNIASNGAGYQYLVKVTDTNNVLTDYVHTTGAVGVNSNSQNAAGYCMTLTPAAPSNQTGDFGYAPNPNAVGAPKFTKTVTGEGDIAHWRLVWINQSAVNDVLVHIEDAIPAGSTYIGNSLKCQPQGSSTTTACAFDTLNNKLIWDGQIDADQGHADEASAQNEVVVTFDTKFNAGVHEATNQASGCWDQNDDNVIDGNDGNVGDSDQCKSDDPTKPGSHDPTVYRNTAAGLADTGRNILMTIMAGAALLGAALLIVRHRSSIERLHRRS